MFIYPYHPEDLSKLDNNFQYHKPLTDQPERYEALRAKAKELALLYLQLVPTSRERSLALTELESSVMWANAGIARNEKDPLGEK